MNKRVSIKRAPLRKCFINTVPLGKLQSPSPCTAMF
jgi:hypothetical protein